MSQIYYKNLSGWGRYPQKHCACWDIHPGHQQKWQETDFEKISIRGMGRSYGDASLGDKKMLVLSSQWEDKIVSFDDKTGVIKAYAGISLEKILENSIPHGWFLPVSPGTRFVSLGGAVASNVHGKNQHCVGSFGEHVVVLGIHTEKGYIECSGDNNADLFYATIGGYGLTGYIEFVTLKLKRITSVIIRTKEIKVCNIEELIYTLDEHGAHSEYSIAWIDIFGKGRQLGRGVVYLGEHLEDPHPQWPLLHQWKRTFLVPKRFPGFFLNLLSNKLLNEIFYRKTHKGMTDKTSSFEKWFYPLDLLLQWNHLYGIKGFVQYQFSMPKKYGVEVVRKVLKCIQEHDIFSFVMGLKQTRKDVAALPFCDDGYTLGMDFSLRCPKVFTVLDKLDKIILNNNGRCYLTKDARLRPDIFRLMYPEYPQWINTVTKYCPEKKYYSSLARRLEL